MDFEVGQSATATRTVTEEDVNDFVFAFQINLKEVEAMYQIKGNIFFKIFMLNQIMYNIFYFIKRRK